MTPSLVQTPYARLPGPPQTLIVNPLYAYFLRRCGLRRFEDFLSLHETIVSGHPDRRVSRVTLAVGNERLPAFLKREHRVPWKERLASAWAGHGWASKSWREARTLRNLRQVFGGCPDWIAAGEAGGEAFLLVREVQGAVELVRLLASLPSADRRRLARGIGEELARLHAAGYTHGDLYANHVLVDPYTERICFIDWQRAVRRDSPTRRRAWRDLAALSATLAPVLASARDRLVCLRAYLGLESRGLLREAVAGIERMEIALCRRRHVRGKRLPPPPDADSARLACLPGGLFVTPGFLGLWPGAVPDFLTRPGAPLAEVPLPDGGQGLLVRCIYRLPARSRPHWTSPQRAQMNLLFRLRRAGVEVPEVLGAGERPAGAARVEALLLTRIPPNSRPLAAWLSRIPGLRQRWQVLRQAGVLLSRLHAAGCFFRGAVNGLAVRQDGDGLRVLLACAANLRVCRRFRFLRARRDFARLAQQLGCGRTDMLRLRRGYDAAAKPQAVGRSLPAAYDAFSTPPTETPA
jgi:tRNA A-37 threonylcarbamoyl transferase component Bud32